MSIDGAWQDKSGNLVTNEKNVKMIFKNKKFNPIKNGLPESKGVFLWKTKIDDFDIVFPSNMRTRGAGLRNIISPEFDHWNGSQVLLPNQIESWAESQDEFNTSKDKNSAPKELKIIGVSLNSCPFCKNEPIIKYNWRSPFPNKNSTFEIKCCSWINRKSFNSLTEMVDEWNRNIDMKS